MTLGTVTAAYNRQEQDSKIKKKMQMDITQHENSDMSHSGEWVDKLIRSSNIEEETLYFL